MRRPELLALLRTHLIRGRELEGLAPGAPLNGEPWEVRRGCAEWRQAVERTLIEAGRGDLASRFADETPREFPSTPQVWLAGGARWMQLRDLMLQRVTNLEAIIHSLDPQHSDSLPSEAGERDHAA